jgi:aminopeptidase N
LWLEKKKGTKAMEQVLDEYRDHLTAKDDQGKTPESAGPIIWGSRLESSQQSDAWRAITYEKGSWIFHMLRRRLGDERFMKMLAELRKRYEFKGVSTDNLRELAKEFLPPKTSPAVIDAFFENWVYATGIPTLKLKFAMKGVAPAVKVTGSVTQSGVDDDFTAEVPVEIQFAKGSQTIWVRTSNEAVPFSATVKLVPTRVVIPDSVLARR